MADSDEDYVNSSGDEAGAHIVSRRGAGGSKGARPPSSKPKVQKKEAWEDIKRSWDNVVEGADGSINVTGLLEAGKRKRYFLTWIDLGEAKGRGELGRVDSEQREQSAD